MEYNSFYGGRRGASFIIVKEYESIAAMIECFQQGGAYRTVNYDEYVLINTVNLNDRSSYLHTLNQFVWNRRQMRITLSFFSCSAIYTAM